MSEKLQKAADREQLLEMADDLLNEEGSDRVREHLDADEFRLARIALLAAIDKKVLEGSLPDIEARAKYQILGFDPEDANKIRNRNTDVQSE